MKDVGMVLVYTVSEKLVKSFFKWELFRTNCSKKPDGYKSEKHSRPNVTLALL